MKLAMVALGGRNRIIDQYREMAREVVMRNGLVANVDEILFLVDEEAARFARTASDIGVVPAMLHDVIFQLTETRFQFYVKFIAHNLESVSTNVLSALFYHELRHIKKSAKTGLLYLDKRHDIEDWREMVSYGDWEHESNVGLPNFLEEDVYGGKSVGTDCGVGVSGAGGGLLALPLGEGTQAIESGYRGAETLSGVHFEGGEE